MYIPTHTQYIPISLVIQLNKREKNAHQIRHKTRVPLKTQIIYTRAFLTIHAMYNKGTLLRVRATYCCGGKAISITYSESMFIVLGFRHALRMRRIILSSVACPAVQYFSILSHVLIYGAETWSLYEDDRRRINGTEMEELRRSARISKLDRKTNGILEKK